jgi:putative FmdB family regulatory protein
MARTEEIMPIYEYGCTACGKREERLQGLSAAAEHDCPDCGAPAGMRRLVSKAAFMLSGGGWYASGYGEAGKASESPAAGAAKPAEAKPETPGCAGGCACHAPAAKDTPGDS